MAVAVVVVGDGSAVVVGGGAVVAVAVHTVPAPAVGSVADVVAWVAVGQVASVHDWFLAWTKHAVVYSSITSIYSTLIIMIL